MEVDHHTMKRHEGSELLNKKDKGYRIYPWSLEMQVLNVFFLPKIVLKKFTIELAIPHFFNPIVFKNKYV